MKKSFFTLVLLSIVSLLSLSALESENLSFRLIPGADLPLSTTDDNNPLYTVGLSGSIGGRYVIPEIPFLYLDGSIGYKNAPLVSTSTLHLINAGIGGGLNLNLSPSISLQGGVSVGAYTAIFDNNGSLTFTANPSVRGAIEVGLAITPNVSVVGGAAYDYFLTKTKGSFTDLHQGISGFMGLSISLGDRSGKSNLEFDSIDLLPVFPVFHKYYNDNSLGTISIKNDEIGDIKDVRVSFYSPEYMDGPKECFQAAVLKRGETLEVPLYALFSSSIMDNTEATLVNGQISVEYEYNGREMTKEQTESIRIYDRNAMTWDDDRKAASFITAKDPSVLQFARNVAGVVRSNINNPINLNFRIAMGIFEAMRSYGINYVIDPQTPYIEQKQNAASIDYLQFPVQTLSYLAGDCDDLSILYSSLLESVGIETAFITIPGHIYMAFSLGISEEQGKKLFKNKKDLIFMDGETWVPLEITLVQDGFIEAWRVGGIEWRDNMNKNTAAFYKIHQAWNVYEPVGIKTSMNTNNFPSQSVIGEGYQMALDHFITREVGNSIIGLQEKLKNSTNRKRDLNKLGLLYAQYGLYDQAIDVFSELAGQQRYVPAMINLGNIFYMKKDQLQALHWYTQVENQRPDNLLALVGLIQVNYKLENYEMVSIYYDRLKNNNAALAEKYSVVAALSDDSNRASMAGFVDYIEWAEEEE